MKDLRFAARLLASRPGHTATAVLALGLGIALSTTMFSLVHGIFLRGLPFDDAHRIVRLDCEKPREGIDSVQVSQRDFAAWRSQQTAFEDLAGWIGYAVKITGPEGHAEQLTGSAALPELFDVVGVRPFLGRTFTDGDEDVALVSYRVWRDRLGGDPDVLGKPLRLNGRATTVVGVMPEGFHFPLSFDFWFPLRIDPRSGERRFGAGLQVVGRLRDGVSLAWAQAEMDAIAARLAHDHPESNEGVEAVVEPYVTGYSDLEMRSALFSMQGVVLAVLLVACANVANLVLARALSRTRELAVRRALGAGRGRLVRQLLTESLLLAVAGGLLGLGLTSLATGLLHDLVQPQLMSFWVDIRVDWQVTLFVAALVLFSALAAGLVPALKASGSRVNEWLKERSGSPGRRAGHLGRTFTTVQITLSCALLVVTGLMLKSFVRLEEDGPKIAADEIWTGSVFLGGAEYPDRESFVRFQDAALARLASLPEVRGAALGSPPSDATVTVEGRAGASGVRWSAVSAGYFSTLGVGVTEGRGFLSSDGPAGEPVALVSRGFARRHFGSKSALGRRLRFGDEESGRPWRRVVGVVPDGVGGAARPRRVWGMLPRLGDDGAAEYAEPADTGEAVYLPLAQSPSRFLTFSLWTKGEPLALTPRVREAVAALDPELPIVLVGTLAETLAAGTWDYRLFGGLFVVFGAVAFFLAMVGLYGVMAFFVGQRTRELGIRMALGARAADVVALTLGKGSVPLAVGLGFGLVFAAALARLLEALLYHVEPWDVSIFAAGAVALVASGLAACWVPARRAARVDPMVVLRSE